MNIEGESFKSHGGRLGGRARAQTSALSAALVFGPRRSTFHASSIHRASSQSDPESESSLPQQILEFSHRSVDGNSWGLLQGVLNFWQINIHPQTKYRATATLLFSARFMRIKRHENILFSRRLNKSLGNKEKGA